MLANFIEFLLLGSVFGHFFDTQLMNFIWKYIFLIIQDLRAVSLLLTESH